MKKFPHRGKRVGIFAVDPGSTTGIAYGIVTMKGDTKEILADKLTVAHVDCHDQRVPPQLAEQTGIHGLEEFFVKWNKFCMGKHIPVNRRYLIIEDFVLRETGIGSTNREGLSPVRVTSGLLALITGWGGNIVFQSASDAKGSMPNDRLRSAGLWVRGLEHGRDAVRHAATWVRRQM